MQLSLWDIPKQVNSNTAISQRKSQLPTFDVVKYTGNYNMFLTQIISPHENDQYEDTEGALTGIL